MCASQEEARPVVPVDIQEVLANLPFWTWPTLAHQFSQLCGKPTGCKYPILVDNEK
jgi:hypothetical protein